MVLSGFKNLLLYSYSIYRRLIRGFTITLEEVTEKAIAPYVQETIIKSGLTTAVVKYLPWTGVLVNSAGLYKDISYGLAYSEGVSWLARRIMH